MTNSSWEDYLENQIIEAGFPKPVREYKFLDNRKFRLDLAWPFFKFGVEVHGGVFSRGRHTSPTGFTKDREKMNLLTLEGWRGLEITSAQVNTGQGIEWIKTYFDRIQERFFSKVEKTDNCWEWTACKNKLGYGSFCVGLGGVSALAHRTSYLFANREISENTLILHSCNNPGCVNPAHLREGSDQDNMDDKVKSGRAYKPSGAKNPNSKLSEAQVAYIKRLLENGAKGTDIAKIYGVTPGNIYSIKNGKTHKEVKSEEIERNAPNETKQ